MRDSVKSARDGVVSGGTAGAVALVLTEQFEWADASAWVVGMAAAAAVAFGYRVIRHYWPWLADADPTGEAQ